MFKGGFVVCCIAFVCVLSSGAFAVVGQAQNFHLGAGNAATLTGEGTGAVASTNLATVINTQDATNASGHIRLLQLEAGSLVQGASAAGMSGIFSVGQGGEAVGAQLQIVPTYFDLGTQVQNLDAVLGQDVLKIGGLGSALGIQSFIGCQVQFIITPFGMSANVQYVGVVQGDAIGGGPDSTMMISEGVSFEAGQS